MLETSDIRKGLKVQMEGVPFEVIYFQFVKPGKGQAFTRTKLRNMMTGTVFERTFNRCMGLWADGQTLWLSSLYQLWRFENVLKPAAE